MLGTAKPICFIATAKPSEAEKFYRDTLGLTLLEDGPFAIVFDAAGTMLRVQKVQAISPSGYTALGWEVHDIHSAVRQLQARGVRFERYEGISQDELGIWTTPSGSSVAWFKDLDGNILSITQPFSDTNL